MVGTNRCHLSDSSRTMEKPKSDKVSTRPEWGPGGGLQGLIKRKVALLAAIPNQRHGQENVMADIGDNRRERGRN